MLITLDLEKLDNHTSKALRARAEWYVLIKLRTVADDDSHTSYSLDELIDLLLPQAALDALEGYFSEYS